MIMNRYWIRIILIAAAIVTLSLAGHAATIMSGGQPAQLDIRAAGDHSIRITLRPLSFSETFPYSPALVERRWPEPAISLRSIDKPVARRIGGLQVRVKSDPQLTIEVTNAQGQAIQTLVFDAAAGTSCLSARLDAGPRHGRRRAATGAGVAAGRGHAAIRPARRPRSHDPPLAGPGVRLAQSGRAARRHRRLGPLRRDALGGGRPVRQGTRRVRALETAGGHRRARRRGRGPGKAAEHRQSAGRLRSVRLRRAPARDLHERGQHADRPGGDAAQVGAGLHAVAPHARG